ncbi:hypothetical protein F5887DRAFT_1072484 [Amanita rubescens]|nr:hypothetical protein F5887DRAFT_1072484 [Amanita rubescens]
MSSPFNLELIMLAMPGSKSSKRPYHIDMLPTEIIRRIFDLSSRLSSSGRRQVQQIILVSHVSRHWRDVTLIAPTLWDHIDLNSYRRPDILRTFLARSNQRSLSIRIDWPKTIFWSSEELPEFSDTCRALAEQLPRISKLSITGRNSTLRDFTLKVLVEVALPHLQHLELVSCTDLSPMLLGPFRFNPAVFSSLSITRTMVCVADGGVLAGVRRLVLKNARLSCLDERKIPSTAPPAGLATLYTDLPKPSFSSLTDLEIHAPLVHPVPGLPAQPIVNIHSGETFPPLPFAPSFRTDILRSVILSSLSLSMLDYGTNSEATPELLARLFRIVSMAELQELHLIDLRDQAISGFLQTLEMQHCRFSYLRVLKFTAVPLEDIIKYSEVVGLEKFGYLFSNAFPAVRDVHLAKLDPTPLLEIFRKVTLWPMLEQVEHEGTVLNIKITDHV